MRSPTTWKLFQERSVEKASSEDGATVGRLAKGLCGGEVFQYSVAAPTGLHDKNC